MTIKFEIRGVWILRVLFQCVIALHKWMPFVAEELGFRIARNSHRFIWFRNYKVNIKKTSGAA